MPIKKRVIHVALPLIAVVLCLCIINLLSQKQKFVKEVDTLKTRLEFVENELRQSQTELKRINALRYKNVVYNKKYPLFSKIVEVAYKKAIEYDFDPNLVLSLIQIESNFKPFAVSSKGAFGLMQINYAVWKDELNINFRKIFDIEYNIDLGLQVLKRYYHKTGGDLLKTLHLYNNGYVHNNEEYKYKVISTCFY